MKMSQKSAQSRLDMFGLDVRSAHRQCLLDHKELRFATARLAEDEVYVNAVCTYGIASAQWWWGSQGAALHRIILHFFEGDSESLRLAGRRRLAVAVTSVEILAWDHSNLSHHNDVGHSSQMEQGHSRCPRYVSGLATMSTTYVAMEVGIDEGKGRCVAKRLYDLARAEYSCKQELLEIAGFMTAQP